MIKVYEVLKSLDISYRNRLENYDTTRYTNMNNFYLDVGDFFFVEPGYWGRVEVNDLFGKSDISSNFVETHVLKKILFKSTKMFRNDDNEIDFHKVWEEEDNINLFNPLINKRLTIEDALDRELIAESVAWKRDDILKELGI